MTFGRKLKESRKKKGLTQAQAAEHAGIDDTTLSKYENDKSEPDNKTLDKLVDLYGISIDDLFGRDNMKDHILSNGDKKLLEDFKSLESEDQEYILRFIEKLKH